MLGSFNGKRIVALIVGSRGSIRLMDWIEIAARDEYICSRVAFIVVHVTLHFDGVGLDSPQLQEGDRDHQDDGKRPAEFHFTSRGAS